MPERVTRFVRETWGSEVNLSLFLGLLVLIVFVLPSVGFAKDNERLYTEVSYSVLLASGVGIAWRSRALFLASASIAGVAIVLKWVNMVGDRHSLGIWPDLTSLATIILIVFILLREVFSVGPITANRIQGAIAVYLLFGVAWAHAFHIAEVTNAGSFNTDTHELSSVRDYIYFSFITLTTVGYGDIVPVGPKARALAAGEAVTGQLYLAVLLAHLVSMRISAMGQEPKGRR